MKFAAVSQRVGFTPLFVQDKSLNLLRCGRDKGGDVLNRSKLNSQDNQSFLFEVYQLENIF